MEMARFGGKIHLKLTQHLWVSFLFGKGSFLTWLTNELQISIFFFPTPTKISNWENLKLVNSQQIHMSVVKIALLSITAPGTSPNTDGIHIDREEHHLPGADGGAGWRNGWPSYWCCGWNECGRKCAGGGNAGRGGASISWRKQPKHRGQKTSGWL